MMQLDDEEASPPSTAVAMDRDKNSQQALKWAVDNLTTSSAAIILIHVVTLATGTSQGPEGSSSSSNGEQLDNEIRGLFRSHRLHCARKGIKAKLVILEDVDVAKAIVEYITTHNITSIVCGASNRNALTRKLSTKPDVPTSLQEHAPDFCGVYVIWKRKPLDTRPAKSQAPGNPSTLFQQQLMATTPRQPSDGSVDTGDSVRSPFDRGGSWKRPVPQFPRQGGKAPNHLKIRLHHGRGKVDGGEGNTKQGRRSTSRGSSFEEVDSQSRHNSLSSDHTENFDSSSTSNDGSTSSSSSRASRDVEVEMKRLRQELKQTMDMYNTACKEALAAKQTAEELRQWKIDERHRKDDVRKTEKTALAMVEMEKARAKAAIEAAQTAQRLAELESKKRVSAEMTAKREAEEKKKALEALAHNDVRYRKYTIEEIEVATDNLADRNKIGEGGYGPVYRGILDHTPVAIKVLRPDAAQGKKQFQQEVEVLSCIRHPNMVLLLGACPEYGCLVYEHMDNGSLDDRLFRRGNSPPLPWPLRFKIAAEISTALLFLHQTKPEPLVHRDLKPANILLDSNFVSKISDVGLARLIPPSVANAVTQYRMTALAGTFCYIDPEYQQTGMLGTKSDVYSLGILLLQLVTAKPPMGLAHHVERAIQDGSFRDMLDPAISDWPVEEAVTFAKVALRCSELKRKDRPDLGKVVLPELNRLRAFGHKWEANQKGGIVDSSVKARGRRRAASG